MSKERRVEIKKKQKTKKCAIIIIAVVAAALVIVGIGFSVHGKCDECGTGFWGKGYYKEAESAGVLGSLFGSVFGDTESITPETVEGVVLCQECAKNNVSVKAELRPVSDFKR